MDTTVNQSLNNSTFGCCHQYRQCSDAKRCLLQDEDEQRAKLCSYRRNLEQGTIFYGKNANGFSIEDYTELLNKYNALTGNIRSKADDIILYFAGSTYLTSHILWFYSSELDPLQTLGFVAYYRNHKKVLERYSAKELKIASSSQKRKKEETINYIISSRPEVLSLLSEPYCYVQIPKQSRPYIYELYCDFFQRTQHNKFTGILPFEKSEKQDGG